ncbi:MAG: hypothetical protein ACLGGO_01615 [Coleofasciculus sp.]
MVLVAVSELTEILHRSQEAALTRPELKLRRYGLSRLKLLSSRLKTT